MARLKKVPVRKMKVQVGFKGLANSLDESVLNPEYAKSCANFAFDKGALTSGIGIENASGFYAFPSIDRHDYPTFAAGKKVKKVFLYRRITSNGNNGDRIVARLSDGTFFYTNVYGEDSWHQVPSLVMAGDVDAVNYNYKGNDVLLLSSSFDGLYLVKDDTALVCSKAPKFTSIAVHNERVFGTVNGVNNQVWFSDDFDPANWNVSLTEAGYINFCDDLGQALKVVSFAGYLFVFREYGIMRLTAYGDQSDFVLKKMFTDTGRIYKDTIALCGDSIIFLAEDGLYAFNGYDAVKIGKELPQLFNKNGACAGYLDGEYFLACAIKGDNGNAVDSLVRYDVQTKSISLLSNVKINCVCPVKVHNGSCVVFSFDGDYANRLGQAATNGKVFSQATKKSYKSPENILVTPYVKAVRCVSLVSQYPLTLKLVADGKKYEFKVKGSDKMQTIAIEKSGSVIGFELETEEQNAYVSPLFVSLDVIRGQE